MRFRSPLLKKLKALGQVVFQILIISFYLISFQNCGPQFSYLDSVEQLSLRSEIDQQQSESTAPGTPALEEIFISGISRSGTRVTWKSSEASDSRVEWGTSQSYGQIIENAVAQTTHAIFLSGLAPNATYHLRVCSKNSKGQQNCSADKSFRTLNALDTGFAALPADPKSFNFAAPNINGKTWRVSSDCNDLQDKLNLAAQESGDLNHLVLIPPNTICVGEYVLPNKTGANPQGEGIVVIQGEGAASSNLARIALNDKSSIPLFIGNRVQARLLPYLPKDDCIKGDLFWKDNEDTFSLYQCTSSAPLTWTPIAVKASGSVLPATCSDGEWFYNTSISQHNRRAYWCVKQNTWRNVEFIGGGFYSQWAIFKPAETTKGWRITGVTLQSLEIPTSYISSFASSSGKNRSPLGSLYGCLAYTQKNNSSILFDRVIFDGLGYPNRLATALCTLDGKNVGVTNSYFNEVNRWVDTESGEASSNTIFFVQGPGPVVIQNNYFKNNLGIEIFHGDDGGTAVQTSADDVIVRKNTFYHDPAYNAFSNISNGRHYYLRNTLELKRGNRWLIEGNRFIGGWATVTSGSCLAFTPRPGSSANLKTNLSMRDISIKNNLFLHCPEIVAMNGYSDGAGAQLLQAQRYLIENNLAVKTGIDSSGSHRGWPQSREFSGRFLLAQHGLQDLTIRSNTVYESTHSGLGANFMEVALEGPNTGLEIYDNIYAVTPPNNQTSGIWSWSKEGSEGLNLTWKQGSIPAWSMHHNTFVQTAPRPNAYPPTNSIVSSKDQILFNQNYGLQPQSPFASGNSNSSSTNASRGANINQILEKLSPSDQNFTTP